MNNNMLDFFKAAYQNDSSCIVILDKNRQLIWHNGKHAPFQLNENISATLLIPEGGSVQSGDYSYSAHDTMYDYHLTNVSDEYYIISCSDIPAIYRDFERKYTREYLENMIAESRIEVLSISAAAAQLNDYFEEFEDDHVPPESLNDQTNIIMQNCSRILKKHYLLEELLKYYDADETTEELISCSDIIKTFAQHSSRVIGPRGSTKIICDVPDEVYVSASWKRMEYFLLCVMIVLRKKYSGVYQLKVSACQMYDEAVINMKLIPIGDEEPSKPLLSTFTPLYKNTPVYEIENMIIRKFVERYGGFIIDSTESSSNLISIRMPSVNAAAELKLAEPKSIICNESVITPYHALLWEISDFRYY